MQTLKNTTLFIFLVSILLSGCATLPEPDSANTLLIGKIYQVGNGYPPNNGARLNGKHFSGIVLTFENLDAGEWIDIKSSNGKYHSVNFDEGRYRLINLHLEVKDSTGSNSAGMRFASKSFELRSNEVFNLGEIELIFDYKKGLSYEQFKNFGEVKAEFFEGSESLWLKSRWNNVDL